MERIVQNRLCRRYKILFLRDEDQLERKIRTWSQEARCDIMEIAVTGVSHRGQDTRSQSV